MSCLSRPGGRTIAGGSGSGAPSMIAAGAASTIHCARAGPTSAEAAETASARRVIGRQDAAR